MRLLITGVHGFVGTHLVEALSNEHEIYGLDIIAPDKAGVKHTFPWESLDRPGEIPDVDAIIHLAGKAHDTRNSSAKDEYFQVNRNLTIKVFDYFCVHPKCKKFVFFSTVKAAADSVEGILTEAVIPAPSGPYGESKRAAEQYIINMMNDHPDEFNGRAVFIFRPCMIHGPGNKGNLNLLYSVVKKGVPWPLGAFENRRTFTSVANMCFAVNGVLTKDVPGGIYNMGDDEALSTNELIEEICKSLGKEAHIWKVPKGMMRFMANLGGFLHLPLNPDRLRKLTENYISSNEKIKKALGIDRMPVGAREGLRATLESFK